MGVRVLLKTFPPQQLRIVLHARLLTTLTGTFSHFGCPKIGEIARLGCWVEAWVSGHLATREFRHQLTRHQEKVV